MQLTTKTIREIALDYPATTRVFEEFKIDYCCGGRRSFDEACRAANANPQTVSEKLIEVLNAGTNAESFDRHQKKSPSELIDYIVEKHHAFTRNEIGCLMLLIEKVCHKHAAQRPELIKLRKVFFALCDELMPHMRKEEFILFPYIKSLETAKRRNLPAQPPPFCTVQNPVRMMMLEHDRAGDFWGKIREITNDYAASDNVCPSLKALYQGLSELEMDLHQHIHLENNLLFPQALELEQTVLFGS